MADQEVSDFLVRIRSEIQGKLPFDEIAASAKRAAKATKQASQETAAAESETAGAAKKAGDAAEAAAEKSTKGKRKAKQAAKDLATAEAEVAQATKKTGDAAEAAAEKNTRGKRKAKQAADELKQAETGAAQATKQAGDAAVTAGGKAAGAHGKTKKSQEEVVAGLEKWARWLAYLGTLYATQKITTTLFGLTEKTREYNIEAAKVENLGAPIEEVREALASLDPVYASQTELMQNYFRVHSGGIQNVNEALGVTRDAAAAAFAEQANIVDVTRAGIKTWNLYGSALRDTTQAFEVMSQIAAYGDTELQDIAQTISELLPMARMLNVDINELGGVFALLTNSQKNSEAAATNLASLLRSSTNDTKEAQDAAAELGVVWDANALQAMGLVGYIKYLKQAIDASNISDGRKIELLRAMTGRVEALNALLSLLGDQYDDIDAAVQYVSDSYGVLIPKMLTMEEAIGVHERWKNTWENMQVSMGQSVIPTVDLLLSVLQAIHGILPGLIGLVVSFAASFVGLMIVQSIAKQMEIFAAGGDKAAAALKNLQNIAQAAVWAAWLFILMQLVQMLHQLFQASAKYRDGAQRVINAHEAHIDESGQLIDRYSMLARQQNRTREQSEELQRVTVELKRTYGDLVDGIDEAGFALDNFVAKMKARDNDLAVGAVEREILKQEAIIERLREKAGDSFWQDLGRYASSGKKDVLSFDPWETILAGNELRGAETALADLRAFREKLIAEKEGFEAVAKKPLPWSNLLAVTDARSAVAEIKGLFQDRVLTPEMARNLREQTLEMMAAVNNAFTMQPAGWSIKIVPVPAAVKEKLSTELNQVLGMLDKFVAQGGDDAEEIEKLQKKIADALVGEDLGRQVDQIRAKYAELEADIRKLGGADLQANLARAAELREQEIARTIAKSTEFKALIDGLTGAAGGGDVALQVSRFALMGSAIVQYAQQYGVSVTSIIAAMDRKEKAVDREKAQADLQKKYLTDLRGKIMDLARTYREDYGNAMQAYAGNVLEAREVLDGLRKSTFEATMEAVWQDHVYRNLPGILDPATTALRTFAGGYDTLQEAQEKAAEYDETYVRDLGNRLKREDEAYQHKMQVIRLLYKQDLPKLQSATYYAGREHLKNTVQIMAEARELAGLSQIVFTLTGVQLDLNEAYKQFGDYLENGAKQAKEQRSEMESLIGVLDQLQQTSRIVSSLFDELGLPNISDFFKGLGDMQSGLELWQKGEELGGAVGALAQTNAVLQVTAAAIAIGAKLSKLIWDSARINRAHVEGWGRDMGMTFSAGFIDSVQKRIDELIAGGMNKFAARTIAEMEAIPQAIEEAGGRLNQAQFDAMLWKISHAVEVLGGGFRAWNAVLPSTLALIDQVDAGYVQWTDHIAALVSGLIAAGAATDELLEKAVQLGSDDNLLAWLSELNNGLRSGAVNAQQLRSELAILAAEIAERGVNAAGQVRALIASALEMYAGGSAAGTAGAGSGGGAWTGHYDEKLLSEPGAILDTGAGVMLRRLGPGEFLETAAAILAAANTLMLDLGEDFAAIADAAVDAWKRGGDAKLFMDVMDQVLAYGERLGVDVSRYFGDMGTALRDGLDKGRIGIADFLEMLTRMAAIARREGVDFSGEWTAAMESIIAALEAGTIDVNEFVETLAQLALDASRYGLDAARAFEVLAAALREGLASGKLSVEALDAALDVLAGRAWLHAGATGAAIQEMVAGARTALRAGVLDLDTWAALIAKIPELAEAAGLDVERYFSRLARNIARDILAGGGDIDYLADALALLLHQANISGVGISGRMDEIAAAIRRAAKAGADADTIRALITEFLRLGAGEFSDKALTSIITAAHEIGMKFRDIREIMKDAIRDQAQLVRDLREELESFPARILAAQKNIWDSWRSWQDSFGAIDEAQTALTKFVGSGQSNIDAEALAVIMDQLQFLHQQGIITPDMVSDLLASLDDATRTLVLQLIDALNNNKYLEMQYNEAKRAADRLEREAERAEHRYEREKERLQDMRQALNYVKNHWIDDADSRVVKGLEAIETAVIGVEAAVRAISGFATGGYVPHGGLTMLHPDEFVLSTAMLNALRAGAALSMRPIADYAMPAMPAVTKPAPAPGSGGQSEMKIEYRTPLVINLPGGKKLSGDLVTEQDVKAEMKEFLEHGDYKIRRSRIDEKR